MNATHKLKFLFQYFFFKISSFHFLQIFVNLAKYTIFGLKFFKADFVFINTFYL